MYNIQQPGHIYSFSTSEFSHLLLNSRNVSRETLLAVIELERRSDSAKMQHYSCLKYCVASKLNTEGILHRFNPSLLYSLSTSHISEYEF